MKYLFILTPIFLFIGISKINPLSGDYAPLYRGIIWIISIMIPAYIVYMSYKFCLSNRINFLINWKIKQLEKLINNNANDIEKINEKIIAIRGKLTDIGEVSEHIKEVADANMELWKDQIKIHREINSLCYGRIASLVQNRNEVDLIKHLIKQIKNEPNAGKKIAQLERLVNNIDNKVKSKFNLEINKLIVELKTDARREKVDQLNDRINEFDLKAD